MNGLDTYNISKPSLRLSEFARVVADVGVTVPGRRPMVIGTSNVLPTI